MKKAKHITPEKVIATISLSSGMAGEPTFLPRYRYGKSRIETFFNATVREMPHTLAGEDTLARHPELRAKDLMDAFKDPEIQAIISCIGGDDAIRLLPYIDFDVIRDNPKVFMGYSDSTIIHFMCYKAGLVSFYGPCVLMEFAENVAMHAYTTDFIQKALCQTEPIGMVPQAPAWTAEFLAWSDPENLKRERTLKPNTGYERLQGTGVHSGQLLGGCIEVLEMMKGTTLWPDLEEWRGKLLFLETSEDKPAPIQVLCILRNYAAMGILNVINGILFAKPQDEAYADEYKESLLQVVRDECGLTELPILCNMSFGHNSPICILPLGVMAEIDCEAKSFRILEAGVE